MQDITLFISNHPLLFTSFAFIAILLLFVEALRAKQNVYALAPQQAVQLINHENAQVIDIRPSELFKQGHIIDAQSLPLSDLRTNPKKLEKFRAKPLILVCNTGIESQKFHKTLLKAGYNAYSLAGGMKAWINDQLPIIREKS